ncbi:hypothetical protein B0H16DRAFT_1724859 [Mycena metata]|uniref:Uncharacterized protein n=1 Tax=Mycena metata TaxID=1033252 RepID=A0AAD7IUF7_9AGAR|nr:hypothetical protein B0H16DRAFT_1724859 [Mycena metata]
MGHLWEPVRAKQPEKHVKTRLVVASLNLPLLQLPHTRPSVRNTVENAVADA